MRRYTTLCRSVLLFTLTLLGVVAMQPQGSPAFAEATLNETTTLFLPVVIVPSPPPSIVLVGPEDKVQITNAAPLFTWTPSVVGTYVVELSKDPSFGTLVSISSATVKVRDTGVGVNIVRYPTSNLTGQTLYYWRVGLQQTGETSFTYSDVRTFTTPKRSAVALPSPPTPLTPKNKSGVVGQSDAVVTWTSVPNAIAYRVQVTAKSNGVQVDSRVIDATSASYAIPGTELSTAAPGPDYLWQVKVLDQNGWSDYSAESQFRWIP